MSRINSTIWKIEPHTEAKHIILRKYLNAWLPIITRFNSKVVYIDGFAGPGEYIDNKEGSPLLAIKTVTEHSLKNKFDIIMLFIENDVKRFSFLKEKLKSLKLPSNLKYDCLNGEFKNKIKEILDNLEEKNLKLAPSFVFIDPFGFTGFPLDIIKRIMKNPHCEVLITFMYDEINRFINKTELSRHFNELFGTDNWKSILKEKSPEDRLNFLHNLYKNQLEKNGGIKYVRSFTMVSNKNRPDYFLYFGTNNILGLERMKEAMWKIDNSGTYKFSDATYNPVQPTLFEIKPNIKILEKYLYEKTKGKTFKVKALRDFTIRATAFLKKHCNEILRLWEKENPPKLTRICTDCQRDKICRKRSFAFNDDCIIKIM